MADDYFKIECNEARKKVMILEEENKRLKQRLKNLLEDATGTNLQLLRNIILNYYDDLGNIPIVVDRCGCYKLGVSVEECSVKQLREWSSECDDLKGLSDSTKVLLLS